MFLRGIKKNWLYLQARTRNENRLANLVMAKREKKNAKITKRDIRMKIENFFAIRRIESQK